MNMNHFRFSSETCFGCLLSVADDVAQRASAHESEDEPEHAHADPIGVEDVTVVGSPECEIPKIRIGVRRRPPRPGLAPWRIHGHDVSRVSQNRSQTIRESIFSRWMSAERSRSANREESGRRSTSVGRTVRVMRRNR